MALSGLSDFLERFNGGFCLFHAAHIFHELPQFQDVLFLGFVVGHQNSFLNVWVLDLSYLIGNGDRGN